MTVQQLLKLCADATPPLWETPEALYMDAEGNLTPEGAENARWMLAGPGCMVPVKVAEHFGLVKSAETLAGEIESLKAEASQAALPPALPPALAALADLLADAEVGTRVIVGLTGEVHQWDGTRWERLLPEEEVPETEEPEKPDSEKEPEAGTGAEGQTGKPESSKSAKGKAKA